jgi:hypothetical protein
MRREKEGREERSGLDHLKVRGCCFATTIELVLWTNISLIKLLI